MSEGGAGEKIKKKKRQGSTRPIIRESSNAVQVLGKCSIWRDAADERWPCGPRAGQIHAAGILAVCWTTSGCRARCGSVGHARYGGRCRTGGVHAVRRSMWDLIYQFHI